VSVLINWFKARSLRVRIALVGGVCALLLVLAGSAGHWLAPRTITTTVTDTEATEKLTRLTTENQELSEQLARTQNQLMQLQSMRVTTTHIVKAPGGQTITDIVTKVDTHETTQSQTTQTQAVAVTSSGSSTTTDAKTVDTQSKTVVAPLPDPRFLASVGVGVQPFRGAGFVGLVSLDVRLVGPLYVGAWSTVPTSDLAGTAVGLKLGVRF
jgi:hypothetical protein